MAAKQKEILCWTLMGISFTACIMCMWLGMIADSDKALGGMIFFFFSSAGLWSEAAEVRKERLKAHNLAWEETRANAAPLVKDETRMAPIGLAPIWTPAAYRLGRIKRDPKTVSFAPTKDYTVPAYQRRITVAA